MASTTTLLLFVSSLLLLLSSSATARPGSHFHPCNTLLISYSFSSSSSAADSDADFPTFVAVYRVITPFRSYRPDLPRRIQIHRPEIPHPAAPEFGFSSLQDRAKDILVVVVGLLFGVGCGALTAATMYLAWSLVTNRYEISGSEGYYDDEQEGGDESPKKAGYVKIPAAADPVPAKEGYEKN
ncbi:uncharacterized protein [Typha angustifolia]|uniref:uncharacterized protein n=1 Tax=Typha angustifolia TaxID=59011 RepID=UPI003C2BAE46